MSLHQADVLKFCYKYISEKKEFHSLLRGRVRVTAFDDLWLPFSSVKLPPLSWGYADMTKTTEERLGDISMFDYAEPKGCPLSYPVLGIQDRADIGASLSTIDM